MPMGPAPLGFAYFVGVKFAGYTLAAVAIRKLYPQFNGGIAKVGATRTAIGIGAGLLYGGIWLAGASFFRSADPSMILYFVGLLPVRIAEWMLLVHIFFDRGLVDAQKAFKISLAGSFWSYCLDAIGVGAAFVIPGGVWVC